MRSSIDADGNAVDLQPLAGGESGAPVALTRRQALMRGIGAGLGLAAGSALLPGRLGVGEAEASLTNNAAFGLAAIATTDAEANALKANVRTRALYTDLAVLMPWRSDVARAVKAANPAAKCLIYQNFGAVWCGNPPGSNPDANNSCVIQYRQAVAHNSSDPGKRWLLKDGNGNLIRPPQWPWLAYVNPGGTGFVPQATWNVAGRLGKRGAPWDGVYLDDVNPAAGPSGGNWGVQHWPQLLLYTLGAFAQGLRRAGFLVVANVGWLPGNAAWATYAMASAIDGVVCENFDHAVAPALGALRYAAQHSRWFIAHSYASDPTYTLGGLLIASTSRRQMCCVPAAPVSGVYWKGVALGMPTGNAAGRSGQYLRGFRHGALWVDTNTRRAKF